MSIQTIMELGKWCEKHDMKVACSYRKSCRGWVVTITNSRGRTVTVRTLNNERTLRQAIDSCVELATEEFKLE